MFTMQIPLIPTQLHTIHVFTRTFSPQQQQSLFGGVFDNFYSHRTIDTAAGVRASSAGVCLPDSVLPILRVVPNSNFSKFTLFALSPPLERWKVNVKMKNEMKIL